MDKRIIFAVITVVILIIGGSVWIYLAGNKKIKEENIPLSPFKQTALDCESSGGRVISALCCPGVGDFPNLCLLGACGCAPNNAEETKICDCPPGYCFDGQACVTQ
jgi:hypothetical protein